MSAVGSRIPALAVVMLVAASCPVPPPRPDACLEPAWDAVSTRWPTVQAALDDRDVYGRAVWFWAHQRGSVDGFGAVLATIEHRIDPRVLTEGLPDDEKASGDVFEPSLLFFDQTDGPSDTWPVIGMGFHYDFDPCERPVLACADPSDFFVHEAGYHATPIGDGGMLVATPDDVKDGTILDEAGCTPVRDEDLKGRVGAIKHGRAWVTHVWFPPEGEDSPPIWAVEDPWERWRDAVDRSEVVGRAFFGQEACDCAAPVEAPARGCQ
ncbi:MAG: hypothetical protein H6737_18480 [Alphaproteobacteria bacterium]|nr:hypothetical protein [Alphaproteobacteria bacterium]